MKKGDLVMINPSIAKTVHSNKVIEPLLRKLKGKVNSTTKGTCRVDFYTNNKEKFSNIEDSGLIFIAKNYFLFKREVIKTENKVKKL